jgi:hypothetical protein
MQPHPSSPGDAVAHAIANLAAGYIGLDFAGEVGDLLVADKSSLPANQKDYWARARVLH